MNRSCVSFTMATVVLTTRPNSLIHTFEYLCGPFVPSSVSLPEYIARSSSSISSHKFTCNDTKIDNPFPHLSPAPRNHPDPCYAPYQELCRPIASFGEAMFCAPNLGEWFDSPIRESDLDIESDLVIVIRESAPSARQLDPICRFADYSLIGPLHPLLISSASEIVTLFFFDLALSLLSLSRCSRYRSSIPPVTYSPLNTEQSKFSTSGFHDRQD